MIPGRLHKNWDPVKSNKNPYRTPTDSVYSLTWFRLCRVTPEALKPKPQMKRQGQLPHEFPRLAKAFATGSVALAEILALRTKAVRRKSEHQDENPCLFW